jgi:hypothetical protein
MSSKPPRRSSHGTPQKSGSPRGGALPSSEGTSPILLLEPTLALGPSLHSMIVGDFTTAQLADNLAATHIQAELEVHAIAFDQAINTHSSLAATFLKKFDEIAHRLDGMQMTITAIREDFNPCLATLDERITTTNKRIEDMASSTATMLCREFSQKFDDLNKRIGMMDENLKAKLETWGKLASLIWRPASVPLRRALPLILSPTPHNQLIPFVATLFPRPRLPAFLLLLGLTWTPMLILA